MSAQFEMQASMPAQVSAALSLQGVGKEYRLYDSPRQRLRAVLTGQTLHRSHWALRDVSLTMQRGECLGVIGDNGAGKSTLLKLLAGTLQPSTGQLQVRGRITAILELGAGFHPEFTGRENLFFAGSLMGLTPAQLTQLEPEIVEFAELHDAMQRPVKTYSSGMVVRLAFALVTAVQPDVLIIDEALAVGDQHFQKKCLDRILAFRSNGCSILFCSHSPYHIRHLCDRALWLQDGQVQALGPTEQVLAAYEAASRQNNAALASPSQEAAQWAASDLVGAAGAGDVQVPASAQQAQGMDRAHWLQVQVLDLQPAADTQSLPVLPGPDLLLELRAHVPGDVAPSFGVMLEQLHGVGITAVTMHSQAGVQPVRQGDGSWAMRLRFPALSLCSGDYVLSAYLFDGSGLIVLDEWLRFLPLRFVSEQPLPGLVHLPHVWEALP